MIGHRLMQLRLTPIAEPTLSYHLTNCGGDTSESPVVRVLEQSIDTERRVIDTYDEMLDEARDVDPITHGLARQIREQAAETAEDLRILVAAERTSQPNEVMR
jgi:hypothetical protein